MSTTPKYTVTKNINRNGRSSADMMKLIVATILEMDSNLNLVDSGVNKDGVYYAKLRVRDSNVGFSIFSNSNYFIRNGCFKADGSWVDGKYTNSRTYFWEGTIFTIGHYSIGNCYSGFFVTTTNTVTHTCTFVGAMGSLYTPQEKKSFLHQTHWRSQSTRAPHCCIARNSTPTKK